MEFFNLTEFFVLCESRGWGKSWAVNVQKAAFGKFNFFISLLVNIFSFISLFPYSHRLSCQKRTWRKNLIFCACVEASERFFPSQKPGGTMEWVGEIIFCPLSHEKRFFSMMMMIQQKKRLGKQVMVCSHMPSYHIFANG